jgi:hypothetical protein
VVNATSAMTRYPLEMVLDLNTWLATSTADLRP